MNSQYVDDYATCERTYVTLRVYADDLSPEQLTAQLGIQASRVQEKGEMRHPAGRLPIKVRQHGWFLTSEHQVESRDLRRHLDWLLDAVEPASRVLATLVGLPSVRADVACFWASASGHGGPTLSAQQLSRLGALGLDCWVDFYAPSVLRPSAGDGSARKADLPEPTAT